MATLTIRDGRRGRQGHGCALRIEGRDDRTQLGSEHRGRLVASRFLPHQPSDDSLEPAWQSRLVSSRTRATARTMTGGGRLSGDHLKERSAQRTQVVLGGPGFATSRPAGQSDVEQFRGAFGCKDDLVGAKRAVHDPLRVRFGQRVSNLCRAGNGPPGMQGATCNDLPQRLARYELARQEELAGVLGYLVEPGDTGMRKSGQRTGSGHEVRTLEPWTWHVGGVQSIVRDPQTGILNAGADPRRDGQAVAF